MSYPQATSSAGSDAGRDMPPGEDDYPRAGPQASRAHRRNIKPVKGEDDSSSDDEEPIVVVGKSYPTYKYTDLLVRFPTVFVSSYAFIPLILAVVSLSLNTSINTSIDDFTIAGHPVADAVSSYNVNKAVWLAKVQQTFYGSNTLSAAAVAASDPTAERTSIRYRMFVNYEFDMARYMLDKGVPSSQADVESNLLSKDSLVFIRNVEAAIMRLPSFTRVCWRSAFRGADLVAGGSDIAAVRCTPLNSLLTFYYIGNPYNTTTNVLWDFNGVDGSQQQPLSSVESIIFNWENRKWFMDQRASKERTRTQLLRTQINLGSPLPTRLSGGGFLKDAAATAFYDQFASDLVTLLDGISHKYIRITYGGDRFADVLLEKAISADTLLVVLPAIIIIPMLWYHFHSLVLALMAVFHIAILQPVATVIYIGITRLDTLPFMYALAFYVSTVISLDSILIFFDTFRHSGVMTTTGKRNLLSISQRIAYTYRKAGVGISISSLITFIAFTVASSTHIIAVRAFSTLMWITVLCNWFLIMTYFPAAILFHHFHISRSRRNLQRQKEILINRSCRKRDGFLADFLKHHDELRATHNQPTYRTLKTECAAALEQFTDEKKGKVSFWHKLKVGNPMAKLPNPFGQSRYGANLVDAAPSPQAGQEFLDQFADVNPSVAAGAQPGGTGSSNNASGGGPSRGGPDENVADPHLEPIDNTFHVKNMTPEDMMDFDDGRLRFQLIATGRRTPAEFLPAELSSVAATAGVTANGRRAEERLPTMMRTVVALLYGEGRTLKRIRIARNPMQVEGGEARVLADDSDANHSSATSATVAGATSTATPPPAPGGRSGGVLDRFSAWWEGRRAVERKWCCGLLGERVGETDAEKQSRIMTKAVKEEQPTFLERFLCDVYAPFMELARFPLMGLQGTVFIAAAVLTSFVTLSYDTPVLLNTVPTDVYPQMAKRFGETGTCDRCSAFFLHPNTFPLTKADALSVCAQTAGYGQLMFAEVDKCGLCFGGNNCLDCAGVPHGEQTIDDCGQCRSRSDLFWNACVPCLIRDSSLNCSYCHVDLKQPYGFNGPNCAVQCSEDTCPAKGGICNPSTGQCECHASWTNGFWASSATTGFCSVCAFGFTGASCTVECDSTASALSQGSRGGCQCSTIGRCLNCIPGYYGVNCTIRNVTKCEAHGNYVATQCVCNTGWGGNDCDVHTSCNYRGYQVTDAGWKGCKCIGQFRGPLCEYCACFNGGSCDAQTGACLCIGAWGGADCRTCTTTCSRRGLCPASYNFTQYSTMQCRALYCSDNEFLNGISTSLCAKCNPARGSTPCLLVPTEAQCRAATNLSCEWDPLRSSCVSGWPLNFAPPSACECKGLWRGGACTTCATTDTRVGVSCNDAGEVVGCDGETGPLNQLKVVDSCGLCGGNSQCRGCDGIPGSLKIVDNCGECGGNNDCYGAPTETVTIVHGLSLTGGSIKIDITDAATQAHLNHTCVTLTSLDGILTDDKRSTCIWADFARWLTTKTRSTDSSMTTLAFEFVAETGRYSEMGFTTANLVDKPQVTYIANTLKTRDVRVSDPLPKLAAKYSTWTGVVSDLNNPRVMPLGRQPAVAMASVGWVRLFTLRATLEGTVFSLVLGLLLFAVVMGAATCSPTMTLAAVLVLSSSVLTVTASFYIAGYQLGIVERLTATFILGLSGEQLVHLAEGYMEHLHTCQSHLFARETTRLQSISGMFRRVGRSLLHSTVTLFLCSCFLFAARLVLYRRVAAVMLISLVSTIIHSMLFFPAILVAFGPTASFRNRRTASLSLGFGMLLFLALFLGLFLSNTIGDL